MSTRPCPSCEAYSDGPYTVHQSGCPHFRKLFEGRSGGPAEPRRVAILARHPRKPEESARLAQKKLYEVNRLGGDPSYC